MKPSRMPSYGGQALMEGVLMRGKRYLAAAFRNPDGEIEVRTEPLKGIYRSPVFQLPFIRGVIGLWDAIGLGTRYLGISANIQNPEEKIDSSTMTITMVVSFVIGIALFFAAPALAGHFVESTLSSTSFISNLIEGLIRLILVLGYMWAVGSIPEIERVFSYHGAEHKTINAFEANASMDVETVERYSLAHPRCGTAFLLVLVVISIIFFALLGPLPAAIRLATRILFLPLLAGISYEYLRFLADHIDHPIIQMIGAPNLSLQKLTTREPDRSMLEVAITAFTTMRELEESSEKTNC